MLGQLARFGADTIEEDSEKNPDVVSLDRCLDILIAFHTVPQGACGSKPDSSLQVGTADQRVLTFVSSTCVSYCLTDSAVGTP